MKKETNEEIEIRNLTENFNEFKLLTSRNFDEVKSLIKEQASTTKSYDSRLNTTWEKIILIDEEKKRLLDFRLQAEKRLSDLENDALRLRTLYKALLWLIGLLGVPTLFQLINTIAESIR